MRTNIASLTLLVLLVGSLFAVPFATAAGTQAANALHTGTAPTQKTDLIDVRDTIILGEKKTYTIDGVRYTVALDFISEDDVVFNVNGERSNAISVGETARLRIGAIVGLVAVEKPTVTRDWQAEFTLSKVSTHSQTVGTTVSTNTGSDVASQPVEKIDGQTTIGGDSNVLRGEPEVVYPDTTVAPEPEIIIDYWYNADLNDDGYVDRTDLQLLVDNWGECSAQDFAGAIVYECVGDVDEDGEVDMQDLLILLRQWHPRPSADLNEDGKVDSTDLGLLLDVWGDCSGLECKADLNEDGTVNMADLIVLLKQWTEKQDSRTIPTVAVEAGKPVFAE